MNAAASLPYRLRARSNAIGLLAGPLLIIALILIMAAWTGDGAFLGLDALLVLLSALPWATLWFASAMGYGGALQRWLLPGHARSLAIQCGLGVAVLLVADASLGRLGLLQIGGSLGAWLLTAIGILALTLGWWRWRDESPSAARIDITATPWLLWTAAPAAAVLLLATTSAPGWLWESEFGGYDALSYHLQLPKEWLTNGAIQPLEHNVYSFLPNYMESAYYHVMILRGDAIEALYACQLLHAGLAVASALVCGTVVRTWTGSTHIGVVATVLVLGTPWVVVVGSLAYNEMAATLMLATGLLMYRCDMTPTKRATAMGILAAAACGAKLTAIAFVAAPLGVALLMAIPARHWPRAILAGAVTGMLALSPYLIGNFAASGNAVFPFATSLFGSGHWSQQQVETWHAAHMVQSSIDSRFIEAWRQVMRYGIGPNPYAGEPWYAQWSILPWLTLLALLAAWQWFHQSRPTVHATRALLLLIAVLSIQIAFWLGFTHIKSRFMLPGVVPAALAVAIGWAAISHRLNISEFRSNLICGVSLLAWSCVSVVIFHQQAGGAPAARIGLASLLAGNNLQEQAREQLGEVNATIFLNTSITEDQRVLLIGEAAPLYLQCNYSYQTTWDRGPLSQAMRAHPNNPQRWLQDLQDAGVTHLFVLPPMLDRWEQAGWNDPLLTTSSVLEFAESHTQIQRVWPSGERLYRLR